MAAENFSASRVPTIIMKETTVTPVAIDQVNIRSIEATLTQAAGGARRSTILTYGQLVTACNVVQSDLARRFPVPAEIDFRVVYVPVTEGHAKTSELVFLRASNIWYLDSVRSRLPLRGCLTPGHPHSIRYSVDRGYYDAFTTYARDGRSLPSVDCCESRPLTAHEKIRLAATLASNPPP